MAIKYATSFKPNIDKRNEVFYDEYPVDEESYHSEGENKIVIDVFRKDST